MLRRTYFFRCSSSPNNKHIYDCIIIGAGLSGLQAAYTLTKDFSISNLLVLEANNRIGGRIQSTRNSKTNNSIVELGAAFYGPGQNRMFTHIENFGLTALEIAKGSSTENIKQGSLARLVTGVHPTTPSGKTFDWDWLQADRPGASNFLVRADINNVLRELEEMMKIIDVADPKTAPPPSPDSQERDDPYNTKQQMN